jgi:hypothetical protein
MVEPRVLLCYQSCFFSAEVHYDLPKIPRTCPILSNQRRESIRLYRRVTSGTHDNIVRKLTGGKYALPRGINIVPLNTPLRNKHSTIEANSGILSVSEATLELHAGQLWCRSALLLKHTKKIRGGPE